MHLKYIVFYISFLVLLTSFSVADATIYFGPNGGFAKINKKRKITLQNGEKVAPTLNNALLDMIERTPKNGQIKIAMYAFSHKETQKALVAVAKKKGVTVKLILDACASWTGEIRGSFKKMVLDEIKLAKKEKRKFDFQMKEIYPEIMKDRGRTRILQDGTVIYGTMHEKFGIFYNEGNKLPLHAFCGSANVSWGAGRIFAENRIFFRNEPAVGLQLAEEFSRLWNEYGTAVTKNCKTERLLPVATQWGPIQIISNSKPIDIEHYQRIDTALMNVLGKVASQGGTIDVAMFSFTHYQLANSLLYIAQRNPGIKVRILLDQTQIQNDENHQGVMGPFMEKHVGYRNLKNFEIRYKWRSNAFGWNEEKETAMLMHQRNPLLHHKCVVVNGKLMALGSYNWSGSAEDRNFENIMIFEGTTPRNQDVINRFMAEYNYIWNKVMPEGVSSVKRENPQVVSGERGRKLIEKIVSVYKDPICREIMDTIHASRGACSNKKLLKITKDKQDELDKKVNLLKEAELLFVTEKDEKKLYHLTD